MMGFRSRPDGELEPRDRARTELESFRNTIELLAKLSQIEWNLDEQFHLNLRALERLQEAPRGKWSSRRKGRRSEE